MGPPATIPEARAAIRERLDLETTRADKADMDRAISSASPITRLAFNPGAPNSNKKASELARLWPSAHLTETSGHTTGV